MINFEDFKKTELKIAKVLNASRIEGAEKLLKLEIDLGDPSAGSGQAPSKRTSGEPQSNPSGRGTIQIIAGLAESHTPQDLIGKEIVVVANLEPRTVFGLKSQGMLLAATDKGKPVLLVPERKVPPGTKVQ